MSLENSLGGYASEIQKLWRGYDKPALFPEAGATSLVHEPGTPGYVTEYHNAVWAGLANGLCATPFWWEYWPEPPVDPLRLTPDERWQTSVSPFRSGRGPTTRIQRSPIATSLSC
jgi:hypothetical protein